MPETLSIDTVRQVLTLLFPMQGVVVVGAGHGRGLEAFRSAESVVFVEARAECIDGLRQRAATWPSGLALQAVVAAQSGGARFFLASNPNESSLIPPEALQRLWRNLKTRSVEGVQTLSLSDLFADLELPTEFCCNWLLIDCFPALPVLHGAGDLIRDLDVVEVRCARDGAREMELACDHSVEEWLVAHGFRQVFLSDEIHPQLGRGIFCRDVRRLSLEVFELRNAEAKLQKGFEGRLQGIVAEFDALVEARSVAEQLANDRAQKIEALNADVVRLTNECETHGNALSEERSQEERFDEEIRKAEAQLTLLKNLLHSE